MSINRNWDKIVTPEEDVIAGCIAAIQALRAHAAAQLSMSHYEILFFVFLKDGITRNELIQQIPQLSATSIKRYIKDLISEYDLIAETDSEDDFRVKHLHLNEKGHRIIYTVVNKMQDCATCLQDGPDLDLYARGSSY